MIMTTQPKVAERQMMYGGSWHAAQNGATFDSVNPANSEIVARVPLAGAADATAAIDAAHAAFPAWSRRTAADRALLIHRVAEKLEAKREQIAATITLEEGKPLMESRNEMRLTIDSLHWYAEEARRAYGSWIPDPVPNRRLLTMQAPVGVCGAIIPWNVPAAMITRKAGPALAVGCTMVLKPAEQTPVTATMVAEAFLEADLPPGVFNVVTGDAPAIGEAMLSDPRVRKISFTGSTEVGRLLMRGSAEHIKRLSLELGGNAPVILFADCDLDKTIPMLCGLKCLNAGQACISANRIYVHASIHDAVAERLKAHAAQLRVGDGMREGIAMGPLIEAEALEKVELLVRDAVEHGAELLAGGERLAGPDHARGFFFAPTVLSGMNPAMRMAGVEIFGPVAPLFKFESEAEVVAAANEVPYGLAAYIFTEDMARAIRVSERLETGMVGVNDIRIGAAEAPFGGVKQSGIGREGGREGMAEYLETKLVAIRVDADA
jgi:succinate-semialdehyde dehydrogenase / glutarate-semialdehyde dehydrogenase